MEDREMENSSRWCLSKLEISQSKSSQVEFLVKNSQFEFLVMKEKNISFL